MVRMETDRDVEFWKGVRMSVFQRFDFGSKIVAILQKIALEIIKLLVHNVMEVSGVEQRG